MPRILAVQELASLLGVLAHADRVRIVEALRNGENDVNQLAEALELSQARVSQHLALLKSHRLVQKRKQGRHAFYSLTDERIATWLAKGLDFIEAEIRQNEEIHNEIQGLRSRWGDYG